MVENMMELQEAVKVAALVSLAHETVTQVLASVIELGKAAKYLQSGDLHLALTIINSLQQDNELRTPRRLMRMCSVHRCSSSSGRPQRGFGARFSMCFF
jgi:hypothetical protein